MNKRGFFYSTLAIFLVVLILSGLLLAACGEEEPGVIKVGAVMTTSGPAASVGTSVLDGVKIAVKHWNDKGGITIDGRKYTIELIEYDSAMKPEQGVSATKKLIEQDQVLVIFGDCISTVALAQKPIIEAAGIPWIVMGAHPDLTEDRNYTFRSNAIASDVIIRTCQMVIKDYGITKWSLLAEESAVTIQVHEALLPTLEAAGATILTADTFPSGNMDFYPLLTKIKAAAPEVVRIDASAEAPTILKQANEIGLQAQWMVSTQMPAQQLVEQIGDLAAGVWQIVLYNPESDRTSVVDFNKEAAVLIDRTPTMLETVGYEGPMRMFMAMELADSLDREKIVEALYQVDWDGVWYTGKYDQDGEGIVASTLMQMTAEGTYAPIE